MNNIETYNLNNILDNSNYFLKDLDKIYVIGEGSNLLNEQNAKKRIAIVGTRNATPAGIQDTRKIAQVVCEAGGIVVSGMASGIDGAAHQGAIDINGKTIAVLGSGVDVIYPNRHKKLYEDILKAGCVVSQFEPGTMPRPWHFPIRNKIIVALCDILIVTEGTLKGGARISVDIALETGKTVLALPGPRRSLASELCNSVIKDGAGVITDPSDVLHEMGIDSEILGWKLRNDNKDFNLSSIHRKVLDVLFHQNADSHDISIITNLNYETIAQSLQFLEKNKYISYSRGQYKAL